ncbi:MAG: hypothetical protein Q7S73_01430 [bacterium]|nr:hypothetical protein [bacterium]
MQTQSIKFKIILGLILFLLLTFCFLLISASAQTTPEFLVSWKASSYVPANYLGKIFPTKNSFIEAGFDLIDKNKVVDLSASNIRWYQDEQLISSGTGLKSIKFQEIKSGGTSQLIRITVGYKGNDLDYLFSIPVASPSVVIDAKVPYKEIRTGLRRIVAQPYFFNVNNLKNLNFSWSLNGKKVSGFAENPEILELDLNSQGTPIKTELSVGATIQNVFNQLELAGKSLNLIVK